MPPISAMMFAIEGRPDGSVASPNTTVGPSTVSTYQPARGRSRSRAGSVGPLQSGGRPADTLPTLGLGPLPPERWYRGPLGQSRGRRRLGPSCSALLTVTCG